MAYLAKNLTKIGALLAFFGATSIALYFFRMNVRALRWIDGWGAATGWAIRLALVAVGIALVVVGRLRRKQE